MKTCAPACFLQCSINKLISIQIPTIKYHIHKEKPKPKNQEHETLHSSNKAAKPHTNLKVQERHRDAKAQSYPKHATSMTRQSDHKTTSESIQGLSKETCSKKSKTQKHSKNKPNIWPSRFCQKETQKYIRPLSKAKNQKNKSFKQRLKKL